LALWLTLAGARAGSVSTNGPAAVSLPARSMLTMAGRVTTPARKASPLFHGTRLPVPPRQHSRWKLPETGLPTNYVSATALLFEQGLADPRDCEYRVVEVGTGEVWGGDGGVVETHGWVLPGRSANRFAICWNGLVYPVVTVGTNADLDADVAGMVTNGLVTWRSVIPESLTVSPQSRLGIKGCLLLRLGRVELATRYWQAQMRLSQPFPNPIHFRMMPATPTAAGEVKLSDADPYLIWATEWAWAMFDRTLCAHMRGDETLARLTAQPLAQVQPKIEAACAQRGITRGSYYDSQRQKNQKPYLDFLGQLPQIVADLERRSGEGDRVSVMQSGLQNITNQTRRIAALIRDLDLVAARQWGQPGWVDLPNDPIVSALIQEGDPAVEPLLDCLEKDQRLTRSVGFGRDFFPHRTVISVSSVADSALRSILQADFNGGVKAMRTYWNQYKGLTPDERCYAILKDDSARGRWLEVAARIVQPENVTTFAGGFSRVEPAPTNRPVRLRGESLRSKSHPSVSDLMARRALEVPEADLKAYDLSAAGEMALKLATWDPTAAGPVAKTLSQRCATVMKYSGAPLGDLLTRLALVRAQAGDPDAFNDYAAWLPGATPEGMAFKLMEILSPLEKYPTNAVLQSAAAKMFADTNSVWSRLPWPQSGDNPVSSGLFKVPAFRVLVGRELERKEVCGSISWSSAGMVNYAITNCYHGCGSCSYTFPEAAQTTNGTSATLRWCDFIALLLANGKHIAPYNPFAPLVRRDEVLEKTKALLR